MYPIFFGSAMTGMSVTELLEKLPALIPTLTSAQEEPLSGVVFKIEREPSGEKVAYIRVFQVAYMLENMLIYSAVSLYSIKKR